MKIQVKITSKTNKSLEGNERKKIKNERGITEQMKKWTEGAVAGIYSAVVPMDAPTDIKKYYFKLLYRWLLNFAPLFFNYPSYFSQFVGNSVDNNTRLEMHLMPRPWEFALFVGNFVDNFDMSTTYRQTGIRP